MQAEPFFVTLRRVLDPIECPLVVSALRQDDLVWSALSDPQVFQNCLDRIGINASGWTPANICLALFEDFPKSEQLQATPMVAISPEYRKQAAHIYEETYRSGIAPSNLMQAGLLALALRERRRLTGTWEGLPFELNIQQGEDQEQIVSTWRTALSCLIGIIPDPSSLLNSLTSTGALQRTVVIDLVTHVIFSQPFSEQKKCEAILPQISADSKANQMVWLEKIKSVGQSALAASLAVAFLESAPAGSKHTQMHSAEHFTHSGKPVEFSRHISGLEELRQSAELFKLAGKPEKALSLMQEIAEGLRCIYSRIVADTAKLAASSGDDQASIGYRQKSMDIAPELASNRTELAAALGSSGNYQEAMAILDAVPTGLTGILVQGLLSFKAGDIERARLDAENAIKAISQVNRPSDVQGVLPSLPDFINMLMDLDMPEEACQMAAIALQECRNDPTLHSIYSKASLACKRPHPAREEAHLALSLEPGNFDLRRNLAITHEICGDWDEALVERKTVLHSSGIRQISDILALANCSLEAGKIDEAILACEEAYLKDPEDGQAHAIHGKALQKMGSINSAVEHFVQATTHAPDIDFPWLALAEIQEKQGNHAQAIETLQAGAHASPLSADIQHALAEICLENGSPSEALPALRKAAQLAPDSAKIALRLGDILRSLGHLDESAFILKRALHYSNKDAELAYELAKTSIAAGDREQAIEALETKLSSPSSDIEPYILYARLLLESNSSNPGTVESSCRLQQAEEAVQKVLADQPDHIEAGILLADILTAADRTQEALDCYQALAEKYQDHYISWSWRIKLGIGKAALALDQIDLALAAMQEASSLNPGNIQIQKTLAETYFSGNLLQEALQAGAAAIKLSNDDPAAAMWFAGLAWACGSVNEAIATLEHASDFAGASIEPSLRLAQMELLSNNPTAARSALSAILHNTGTSAADLQQAAHLYIHAGDLEAAEECLLKSTEIQSGIDTWFELAVVQKASARAIAALETVQTAIALHPGDARLLVLEADLLTASDRIEEGLISLEKVIPVTGIPINASEGFLPSGHQVRCGFPPINDPDIFTIRTDQAAVLEKTSTLLRLKGELNPALEKSLKALELDPGDLRVRNQAVSLAHALLNLDLAYSLANDAVSTGRKFSGHADTMEAAVLYCAKAELEIDLDQINEARETLNKAEEITPSHPRMLANQAYLSAIDGDFLNAEKLLESAIRGLDETSSQNQALITNGSAAFGKIQPDHTKDYPMLSIANAALQLQQWGLALPLYEQALRTAQSEPRIHLAIARAAVLAQESSRMSSSLMLVNHVPSNEYTGQAGKAIFNREILAAKRLKSSPLVDHWQRRAAAAFDAEDMDTSLSSMMSADQNDAPALLWAFFETNSTAELLEIGKAMLEDPEVMLPYALALLPRIPEESLTIAKNMASLSPSHPIRHAGLAIIAGSANDEVEGLQAIEQALQIWPDEPEWHVIAAKLSSICGDTSNELRHWEQAHHLVPENFVYTLSLGRAYLENHNLPLGMEVLEGAVETHPECADAWLALAIACLKSSEYEQAFTCAEKAAILAPEQPEPRLISGQIALQVGQIPTARMHAEAVLQRDPGESQAMLILVRTLVAQGQHKEALDFIDKFLPSARDTFPLSYARISLLKKLSGIAAALQALRLLSVEYPRDAAVHKDLAEMLAANGSQDEAEQAAQAALRLQPYQPELHLLVGSLQRTTGQLDQAIYHLSEAVHQNPEFIEGYLELGKAYQDRRDYAESLNVFRQGITAAPQDPRPCYQAALALKDAKDYLGAETMLRRAANLAPDDVTIRRQLGAMIALNLVHNPMEAVR